MAGAADRARRARFGRRPHVPARLRTSRLPSAGLPVRAPRPASPQNLFCAQHEISHFLAFRKPAYNKALALFGNLPLVVPVAKKFREYHHDHHIFLVGPAGGGCCAAGVGTRGRALVRSAAGGEALQACHACT